MGVGQSVVGWTADGAAGAMKEGRHQRPLTSPTTHCVVSRCFKWIDLEGGGEIHKIRQ